jgi:hypothetical protein
MSNKNSKPKSRKEYDQMKRSKPNDQKSASDSGSIIEKCKKIIRRNNSEN